jgi:5-methylcytosine-specific restriction endonuclease McrA
MVRAIKLARRTREKGGGGSYTPKQWNAIKDHYSPNGECLCCGNPRELTHDHVIPVIKGGSSNISNLQPLCLVCNDRKHIDTIDYRPDGGLYAKWVEDNIK